MRTPVKKREWKEAGEEMKLSVTATPTTHTLRQVKRTSSYEQTGWTRAWGFMNTKVNVFYPLLAPLARCHCVGNNLPYI